MTRQILKILIFLGILHAGIGRFSGFAGIGGGFTDHISQKPEDDFELSHEFSIFWSIIGGVQYKFLPFLATRAYVQSQTTLLALQIDNVETQYSANADVIFRLFQWRSDRSVNVFLGLGFGVVQNISELAADPKRIKINAQNPPNPPPKITNPPPTMQKNLNPTRFKPVGFTNFGGIFQISENAEIIAGVKSPLDLKNENRLLLSGFCLITLHF